MPPTILRTRLQSTGIRRLGGPRNGFRYRRVDGGRPTAADLARIAALRIPPAWRPVTIARSPGAKLQAVGLDAAGRWQYLYRASHTARRARAKFDRLIAFIEALPALRRTLHRDLAREGLPLEKGLAGSILLLAACALRSGAEVYARDHGTFGLATLRPQHVEIAGECIRLRFRGKHRVIQRHQIRSRHLARLLGEIKRLPGRELLKYRDTRGRARDIGRRHLVAYVKRAMGARFVARDFRTWAATLLCAAALRREARATRGRTAVASRTRAAAALGRESAASPDRAIARALRETAAHLGNTPAVVRESYVHPGLLRAFERGRVVSHALPSADALSGRRSASLERAERALVTLLRAEKRGRRGGSA